MGIRWFYDNKIIGTGIGTLAYLVDYNPENGIWNPDDTTKTNTLYFNMGSAVRLTGFVMLTDNIDNGTVFVGYGHNSSASVGTILINLNYGTAKAFWDVGTYQYWKVGLFDPQDLWKYDSLTITYDDPTAIYDGVFFMIDQIAEIYLGKHVFFGEEPTYPFERSITYACTPLETKNGKRHEFHKSKKRSWHFDYANIRESTKDNIIEMLDMTDGGENPFGVSISDNDTNLFIGRFNQESFSFEEIVKNTWNMRFEVTEEK